MVKDSEVKGIDVDFEALIGNYHGDVLSIHCDRDEMAPLASVNAVTDKFTSSPVTKKLLSHEDVGSKADHFSWAKKPNAAAETIDRWLRGN